jgi:hypothetical protein
MLNILQQNNKSTTPTTSEEEDQYSGGPSTMKQTPHLHFFSKGLQLIILSSVNEDNDAKHPCLKDQTTTALPVIPSYYAISSRHVFPKTCCALSEVGPDVFYIYHM